MRSARPRTAAALTVQAVSASAGPRCSCVAASEQTTGRLSQKELPGLKSVASAIAAPASTSARADGVGSGRLQMVDRAGAELDRQLDGPLLGELVAVQAEDESRVAACLEVAPCLRGVERAPLENA